MAASLTHHQKGPQDIDTRVAEQRVTFPEATNNGHPETSAGFDSRQPARASISQNIPSSVEQLQNSGSSASQLNGRMADARIVKEESMTGITSTSMLNGSSSPPRHAPTEQNGSIHNTNSPSHIRVGTDLAQLPNDTAAPRQPASVKTALTNGFGQDRRLTLGSSVSSETSTFGRNRAFRLDLDANHSGDDGTSTPPEKSQERPWNRSHLSTTTGELHQPQEPVLSKLEIQASKKALKRLTCYHWKQKGGCRYRDDECQYAHYDTGMDEGKNTTCFWWWKFGHCKKSERECLYAHRDTGLYAKPPPGYIPQKRKFFLGKFSEAALICLTGPYVPPLSPDRVTKNGRIDHYSPLPSPNELRSSTEDLSARRSPLLRPAAVSSSIPEPSGARPTMSNSDMPASNKAEQNAVTVDPRLSRCPSSLRVDNSETFIQKSTTDMTTPSSTLPTDPVTPGPGATTTTELSSSYNKCRMCDKKVFGSASLCFTCKGTKPATSKAVMKSSPFVAETPAVDTEISPEVEDRPVPESVPPTSPDKPAPQPPNPLKRVNSVLGPEIDSSMFIKKKARIFKPSEPRRTSTDMSLALVESPSVKDKQSLTPGPNAAAGGILSKAPVPLEDLIELERLRKHVALLEKSNREGKRAHDEARRLHAEEKDRADKLREELQALDVRHREMIASNEEERQKAAVQASQSKKEEEHGVQDDAARTPRIARRSKTYPNHTRGHSSIDFDKISNASTQSPIRPRAIRTDKDETKLLRDMKGRGIVFESDDESDDGPEVPPPTPFKPPKDPLWHPPKSSRDLFEVTPQYQQENLWFDVEAKKKEIAARPSRKQTFGRILALSDRQRGTTKVHREVDRCLPPRMVRTKVVDGSGDWDPFHEIEPTKEVEMTCEEFLGVPENALLCVTTTQQLAYRDGALDRWGKLPRVPDDEKFEIGV